MKKLAKALVVATASLAGCKGALSSPFNWNADLTKATIPPGALIEARVTRGGCSGTDVLFSELVDANSALPMPPELGEGVFGFYLGIRTQDCQLIASGCSELTLPNSAAGVSVVVQPLDEPAALCEATACECGACPGETSPVCESADSGPTEKDGDVPVMDASDDAPMVEDAGPEDSGPPPVVDGGPGCEYSYFYRDADHDGYGTMRMVLVACAAPEGYVAASGDCNDSSAAVSPDAVETCNDTDDNCDGRVDEDLNVPVFYRDADGDGYGSASAVSACTRPMGYVSINGDCNDSNSAVHPAAGETCNAVDDDCDGSIDDGLATSTYYQDSDHDGYGDSAHRMNSCRTVSGYVSAGGDCNDSNASIHPGAAESCNMTDDDCDGIADDGVVVPTFYRDSDSDTYGNSAMTTRACTAPTGYVARGGDCDDTRASVKPGATETCNDRDDDCDGTADDGLATRAYYVDGDSDTYGDPAHSVTDCAMPSGYVTNNADCDDTRMSVHPGVTETCNGRDDDCDGMTDEGLTMTYYVDSDGDSYGTSTSMNLCPGSTTSGFASRSGDCDDTNAAVNPGASEACNDRDDDCDGTPDDGLATLTYYRDRDGDGYGDNAHSTVDCAMPTGWIGNNDDCDDNNSSVHPGGNDANCDGIDQDCRAGADSQPVSGQNACGSFCYRFTDGTNVYQACGGTSGWATAEHYCTDRGYHLAKITSLGEHAFIRANAGGYSNTDMWIGANDAASEGNYVWDDGSTPVYTNWASGQPNGGTSENCVMMHGAGGADGKWHDQTCAVSTSFSGIGFLCELE